MHSSAKSRVLYDFDPKTTITATVFLELSPTPNQFTQAQQRVYVLQKPIRQKRGQFARARLGLGRGYSWKMIILYSTEILASVREQMDQVIDDMDERFEYVSKVASSEEECKEIIRHTPRLLDLCGLWRTGASVVLEYWPWAVVSNRFQQITGHLLAYVFGIRTLRGVLVLCRGL